MDVQIKHGTTDITSRTVGYSREHNICTGIGRLQITIEGTYSTSISPHDTISIYENGDFKVKYYVSDIDENAPDGTIILQCQDRSKYLVDYFIPDSYTIDYPSYTRYWIEKFFTEAGITFEFTTDSQGNLLSNYTQLGLQPAYDQIMMLCQLSGWYFYFDGNGKAIVGSLTTDLSSGGSVGKDDILNIKKVSDDKMLRNRAVVWGQYDAISQEYAYADISKHTAWNYDHNDKRTMVISNNNIPNKSSAYSIANILLKEFAKITIEKHLTVHGARNFNLGETLRVDSHVWRGKGLITTFGTTLDRSGGLVTNVILDERCPRLFGFFNFGDYVYVGTFGDGVWRKHIKFDPAWYNFSTGLTNLNITDLHINNGVFGSVGHMGEMYMSSSEEGPWSQVTVTGLDSSLEDNVPSGVPIVYTSFSGIMARATIVDRDSNNVKFGVDTWSGLNTGDYFLTYSSFFVAGSGITFSGVSISGGHRGWILEYDAFGNQLVGGLGSGIYPIHYSGDYDVMVLDLENDGRNDYVSVKMGGGVPIIPFSGGGFNYGKHTAQAFLLEDSQAFVAMNTSDRYELQGESIFTSMSSPTSIGVFNNESIGEREVVYRMSDARFRRNKIEIVFDSFLERDVVSQSTVTSSTQSGFAPIAVEKLAPELYRFYAATGSQDSNNFYTTITYRDWDTNANTVTSSTTVDTLTVPREVGRSNEFSDSAFMVLKGKIHLYRPHWGYVGTASFPTNYIKFYLIIVDMASASVEFNDLISTVNFETYVTGPDEWAMMEITAALPAENWLLQNGDKPSVAIVVREWDDNTPSSATRLRNWLVYSNDGQNFQKILIQEATSSTDPDFLLSATQEGSGQLTGTGRFHYYRRTTDGLSYLFNGTTISIETVASIPFQWTPANIYAVTGLYDRSYIAKNGSDWYFANPQSMTVEEQITFPVDYTISLPFGNTSSLQEMYFWSVRNALNEREIMRMNRGSFHSVVHPFSTGAFSTRATVVGNFFIDSASFQYVWNSNQTIDTAAFRILQRDANDYHLIQEASKPLRIEISNTSPVLSVQDYENTFHSFFVYGQDVTEVFAVSGVQREVRDYRYTLLETLSGMVTTSGNPVTTQILYVSGSGIFTADAQTFSGGFAFMSDIPSGFAERIETSNYVYPGQFIFVTTSGENPSFYQRDNDSMFFDSYSGLPDSRATIIRCDDRL